MEITENIKIYHHGRHTSGIKLNKDEKQKKP